MPQQTGITMCGTAWTDLKHGRNSHGRSVHPGVKVENYEDLFSSDGLDNPIIQAEVRRRGELKERTVKRYQGYSSE
jgi:hypothetical protein